MPMNEGYKMPPSGGTRGTAAGKVSSGLTGIPPESIGHNNMGSASGMAPSSLSGEPYGAKQTGTVFADNRGSQPAGKVGG